MEHFPVAVGDHYYTNYQAKGDEPERLQSIQKTQGVPPFRLSLANPNAGDEESDCAGSNRVEAVLPEHTPEEPANALCFLGFLPLLAPWYRL